MSTAFDLEGVSFLSAASDADVAAAADLAAAEGPQEVVRTPWGLNTRPIKKKQSIRGQLERVTYAGHDFLVVCSHQNRSKIHGLLRARGRRLFFWTYRSSMRMRSQGTKRCFARKCHLAAAGLAMRSLLLLLAVAARAEAQRAPTSTRLTGLVAPTRRGQPEPEPRTSANKHTLRQSSRLKNAAAHTGSRAGIVQTASDLTITALRVGTCALVAHHGNDKLDHADGFSDDVVAKSFGFFPGVPKIWTCAAAAAQLLGSIFLGTGRLRYR